MNAEDRPWRVRDRLTRARYYFNARADALKFIENVSTSEITGEPLRQWSDRLVLEPNKEPTKKPTKKPAGPKKGARK